VAMARATKLSVVSGVPTRFSTSALAGWAAPRASKKDEKGEAFVDERVVGTGGCCRQQSQAQPKVHRITKAMPSTMMTA